MGDAAGRWEVEITKMGNCHVLLLPGFAMLWQGAPVTVAAASCEGREEVGLLAAERPDRDSSLWQVEVHKTLALLPANIRERRLPGFEDLAPLRNSSLVLLRGMAVEVFNLRAGAAYNGLS